MSVQQITAESVLGAVSTAQFPPSTADLAVYFTVLPTSYTLRQTLDALVDADRLVVANPGREPVRWAVT